MSHLLIADDDRTAAVTLAALFKRSGHTTKAVYDGQAALDALTKAHFDIVITPLRMPKVDGLELTHTIQSRWPDTAVIVVTAYGNVAPAVEAMRQGASDFVLKQLDIDALRMRVQKVLAQRSTEQEVERLSARLADYEAARGPAGIVG